MGKPSALEVEEEATEKGEKEARESRRGGGGGGGRLMQWTDFADGCARQMMEGGIEREKRFPGPTHVS